MGVERKKIAIRVPGNMTSSGVEDITDYSNYNKNKIMQKGEKVALKAQKLITDVVLLLINSKKF